MVQASDFQVYKTTNFLGGFATGTQVISGTPNNIFTNIPKNELVVGEDYYACVYFKNQNQTENMDNLKLWLSSKSFPQDTELKWGFEPIGASGNPGYHYQPWKTFNGTSTFVSEADSASLDLLQFSVAAWFKTSADYATTSGMIVNKGGTGTDSAGENMNYGIWFDAAADNKIRGGFEEGSGTDHEVDSPLTYNDGQWHHAAVTYDQVNVRLYIDGTEVGTPHATTTTPETNSHPLVIGRNSRTSDRFFNGDIDEVYVWNNDLSADQILDYYNTGLVPQTANLVYTNEFEGAQLIADKYTAPIDVTWFSVGTEPFNPNVGLLAKTKLFPVWLWLHVPANSEARIDDNAIFSFNFDIPQGGTGSTGGGDTGGTGGNPPPTVSDYKIAVAGDWGCEPETDDVIDLIQDDGYDYIIGVGDNAYESASCWTNRFSPLKSIMNSCYGNHEYSESGGTSAYKNFFGHSLTYFTYKFENVQVFVIDTNINCDTGSSQHNFITDALNNSLNDNTVTWRIAVFHHPMYGASSKHSYNSADTRENFHTLFQTKKVNLVLTGHNHTWQRTKQIKYNSSSPSSPTVVDSTSPYLREATGFIHVVSGTGGHDSPSGLYDLGSQPSYQAYQDNDHNGIWEIVASNSGKTLTCSFVDTTGDKYDTFTMTSS